MVVGPFGPNSVPAPEHVVEVFLDDTESVPFPDPRTEEHSVREMTLKQNPAKHNPVQFTVDTVNGVVMDLVLLHVEMVRKHESEPVPHLHQHTVDENVITLEMLKRK